MEKDILLKVKETIINQNKKYMKELNEFEEKNNDINIDDSLKIFYEKGKYMGKLEACIDIINVLKEIQ